MLAILDSIGIGFIYRVGRDAFLTLFKRYKGMPPAEKIALRRKWKPEFDEQIIDTFSKNLRSDAIIRDVSRVDDYPESDKFEKGISSWFRISLVGTYHRGIFVGMRWHRLVELDNGAYRVLDILNFDEGDVEIEKNSKKVILIGSIPFENIVEVDFEGDEYYGYPHIYCNFCIKKQPYESLTQKELSGFSRL